MILRSIRTFWYKGIATNKEMSSSKKRPLSLENKIPGSKADFFRKVCIWYSEVNIECVAYETTYLADDINYLIHERAYSK